MRILYHHRTQAEDGQAVHIRSMIEAFVAEGHEVHEEALVRRTGPAVKPTSGAGGSGTWYVLDHLPRFARELAEYGYSVPARRRLIRAGGEFKAQLLYERYAFGNTSGVSASRRLGVPMVLEVNSPMVLELSKTRGLSFPRLADRSERWTFKEADRVCVVTHVLAEMLKEMGLTLDANEYKWAPAEWDLDFGQSAPDTNDLMRQTNRLLWPPSSDDDTDDPVFGDRNGVLSGNYLGNMFQNRVVRAIVVEDKVGAGGGGCQPPFGQEDQVDWAPPGGAGGCHEIHR